MKEMAERAERAGSLEELLGIEGNAARMYFGEFAGMIKPDEEAGAAEAAVRFRGAEPASAARSGECAVVAGVQLAGEGSDGGCYAVGFDPYIGFYHQPRFGRPALALDLMEPFRPDRGFGGVDGGEYGDGDGRGISCGWADSGADAAGGRAFSGRMRLRMDTLVTHPLFEYRVSYRRMWRFRRGCWRGCLEGEIGEYPVFTTR